jgi:hypothetical protein
MAQDLSSLVAALAGGRPVAVRVATGSMAPTVRAGDSVTARSGAARAGDVVLVRSREGFTLHRLVARLGPRWVHAGDAHGSGAGLCRPDDVLAVADLPPRLPAWPRRLTSVARAVASSLLRRLRVS